MYKNKEWVPKEEFTKKRKQQVASWSKYEPNKKRKCQEKENLEEKVKELQKEIEDIWLAIQEVQEDMESSQETFQKECQKN